MWKHTIKYWQKSNNNPTQAKAFKTLEVMGQMKHTKYSDHIILSEVESGEHKFVKDAFKAAAEKLGGRWKQTSSQYYKLRDQGITTKETADWTEEDKENFDPGDSEPVKRNIGPKGVSRSKSPEGYGQPWKSYQNGDSLAQAANHLTPEQKEMISATDISHLESENDTVINLINPMKTVLVTYTTQKTPLTEKQIRESKLYAFNTPSEMKKGDIISSESYSTPMQVVEVLDKPATYYNRSTGELSDVFTSTEQRKLATLIIREDDHNTVYGKFVPVKA